MPIDRYTKAVLTIIAAVLLYIAAMLSGQPASAQATAGRVTPQPVVVVGWGTVRGDGQIVVTTTREPDGVVRAAPLPVAVQAAGQRPLPVTIQQAGQPIAVSLGVTPLRPLPVALTGVKAGADWEAIRTRTEPQPLTKYPGPP
jgi:hypothetical protein